MKTTTLNKLIIFAGILFIAASCNLQEEKQAAINPSNMDVKVNPGDDFFRYANGGWLASNPMPDEYSRYGSFEQLREANDEQLKDLITQISNDQTATTGSNRQKIRDFYNSAMDTVFIEAEGINPLKPFMERINNISSVDQLAGEIAFLHSIGVRPWFGLYAGQDRKNTDINIANIGQGGLGMSDRDYYLKDDDRNKEIRNEYKNYIRTIFMLAGYSNQQAEQASETIMKMETMMAEASMDRVTRRNPYATYNMMSLNELKELAPDFNWDTYFSEMGVQIENLNVSSVNFFSETSALLKEFDAEQWKTYLQWNLMRSYSSYLSKDFVDASFYFYSTVMTGTETQQERWKRSVANLNNVLGEAVGQEYVAVHFSPQAKERMLDLVEHLRQAFDQRISRLEWMSEETKQQAHQKLAKMNVKIGYPDKWTDYSNLNIIPQHYALNIMAGNVFNYKRNLEKIGKPVDRDEWFMNPQTVNAYYSPTMNEIAFPAGILQPPFFYMDADDAVNFGAIGMVIGHEMTHGFDDQGRQYALDGNLNDWWTPEDSQRFDKRAEVLVNQYNNYIMLDSLTINGRLSLGENIADLGGLTISYQALQNKLNETGRPELIDGLTPEQRFFISYAQVWRNHIRDQELMRQIKEGPHSPGEARVNGIVYNMEEFYKAFGLGNQDARFITPEERAAIW